MDVGRMWGGWALQQGDGGYQVFAVVEKEDFPCCGGVSNASEAQRETQEEHALS